jgi:hypothetical protein
VPEARPTSSLLILLSSSLLLFLGYGNFSNSFLLTEDCPTGHPLKRQKRRGEEEKKISRSCALRAFYKVAEAKERRAEAKKRRKKRKEA